MVFLAFDEYQNWIDSILVTELRKDYVRHELFKNILNEVLEQSVNNHNAEIVDAKISEYADRFYRPKCDGIDDTEVGGASGTVSAATLHVQSSSNQWRIFQKKNIARYQLYGPTSNPITFWSFQKCNDNFKRWQPLTKPNSEYLDGQWR